MFISVLLDVKVMSYSYSVNRQSISELFKCKDKILNLI